MSTPSRPTGDETRPHTVDGVEIVAGMKVYWNSGNPKTAEGVTVTSVDDTDAMFDDDGEELCVPLEWACSTREACKAFAAGVAWMKDRATLSPTRAEAGTAPGGERGEVKP